MRFLHRLPMLCILALGLVTRTNAEEKNGIQISVQKVTIDRADFRGADVNIQNLDRMMGLRVLLKNMTFKDLAEGEITWEILKRKFDTAALELTSGAEKLQRLKAGEGVELTLGSAKVNGVQNGAVLRKDERDLEITIKQDNREIAKFASKSNFNALLKRAVKVETPGAPAAPTVAPTPAKP